MVKAAIFLFLIVAFSLAQELELRRADKGRCIYHVYLNNRFRGSKITRQYTERPLILDSLRTDAYGDWEKIRISWIRSDSREPCDKKNVYIMGKQNTGLVNGEPGFKFGGGVTDAIFDYPYLKNTKLTVGEYSEHEIELSIPYYYDSTLVGIDTTPKLVNLVQKYEAVEEMQGMDCAKIKYYIVDTTRTEQGNKLKYELEGTLFFAIEEGITVFETAKSSQDIMIKGVEGELYNSKKLRLLSFRPYDAE